MNRENENEHNDNKHENVSDDDALLSIVCKLDELLHSAEQCGNRAANPSDSAIPLDRAIPQDPSSSLTPMQRAELQEAEKALHMLAQVRRNLDALQGLGYELEGDSHSFADDSTFQGAKKKMS